MSVRTYVTTSLFFGVVGYLVFPIDEPALMYFFGAVCGVLIPSLPFSHKWLHSSIVYGISGAILLILFPYYLVAGMTIGYGVHLLLDLFTEKGLLLLYPLFKKRIRVRPVIHPLVVERGWLLFMYASMTLIGVISLWQKYLPS